MNKQHYKVILDVFVETDNDADIATLSECIIDGVENGHESFDNGILRATIQSIECTDSH
jgi:hypothetical protein